MVARGIGSSDATTILAVMNVEQPINQPIKFFFNNLEFHEITKYVDPCKLEIVVKKELVKNELVKDELRAGTEAYSKLEPLFTALAKNIGCSMKADRKWRLAIFKFKKVREIARRFSKNYLNFLRFFLPEWFETETML